VTASAISTSTGTMNISKENFLLSALYDDAQQTLNPSGDDCWQCGGEGYTFDCIDGCCCDAEAGCETCASRCPECRSFEANIERYVRVQILRAMDVPLAIAWAKRKGRGDLADKMSEREVLANLHAGRVACREFSDQERAESACWVEGLL
jgi:hypothetical protein